MFRIIFTNHSRYQLRERSIDKKLVLKTINSPDKIILQHEIRKQAVKLIKRNKKKYLIVVIYEETSRSKKVITAFLTSKIKKYLNTTKL